MDLRPGLNEPVTLHAQAGPEYRSRVEGLASELLTLAGPLDLPLEADHRPGTDWLVSWSVRGGVAVLPTQLVATHSEHGLGLWSLAVTGTGWVEQRRRFVRVPAFGRVSLRSREGGADDDAVPGTLVDISEGALRCSVDPAHAAAPLLDEKVLACFRFGDLEFAVPARVVSRRAAARHVAAELLVVLFDEPNRDADALRKQIFAQQRRAVRAP